MFTLPDLPYEYDALGDYISGDIMKLHHDKHHQTYVDKLNAAVDGIVDENATIESLLRGDTAVPNNIVEAVRNNGGGHYNHALFWQWMSPDGGGEPTGELARAIEAKYGSFQAFVDEFNEAALGVFGSGWCWVLPDATITTSANQDSPLMTHGVAPVLGLDVWEHAYYLDYQNKRDDYVNAWWNVVNWQFVEERYNSAK